MVKVAVDRGKYSPSSSLRSHLSPSQDLAHPTLDPLQETLTIAIAGDARS
jgi:hypothetical protein